MKLRSAEIWRSGQSIACKECGVAFTPTDRSYRKRQAKFCSLECWYSFVRRRSNRICGQCKVEFRSVAMRKFCSRRCLLSSRGTIRACRSCGNEFQSSHLAFCSWKCYLASHPSHEANTCKQCGREFRKRDRATTMRNKYCSMKCQKDYWLSLPQKRRGNARGNDWGAVRDLIRKRDGMMCLSCYVEQGARKPDVDHIVPYHFIMQLNKRSGSEHNPNDPLNLISMCRSCHTQKTALERVLWDGDVAEFYSWVQTMIGVAETVQALRLYGLDPLGQIEPEGRPNFEKGSKRL